MEAPSALDLYKLHDSVRAQYLAMRELAEKEHSHGQWGAVRSLEQACYYLFGAAGWLVQDLSPEDKERLVGELEAECPTVLP